MLFTRDGHNVFLGDMLRGGHAFLVCSGPSLASHDLDLLQQRGIVTCAVNNAATIVRPNYWVSVDDPGNFADVIWRDPGILKFVPLCHMEKKFRVRDTQVELVPSQELVGDMPSVFGFRRNEAFIAEQFLHEDTFNWGNHGDRTDAYGFRGCRSVMLVAVRLMFYLGVRTLYLLGCDFKMQTGVQNYAFEQDRSRSAVRNNNHTFEALNVRFRHLLPYFEREGFQIYNCTPNSGLIPFEHLDYREAVNQALDRVPNKIVTGGMYDRKQRERDQARHPVVSRTAVRESEKWLPPTTLFTTLDKQSAAILPHTWQTWMRFHPWLASRPAYVLHPPGFDVEPLRKVLARDHPTVQFLAWAADSTRSDRDRWARAWLQFPAQQVKTPWYLKLEPEAVATEDVQWLKPEWFEPDGENRQAAWIAPAWGYSKPASTLQTLDDWGDKIPQLASLPRLNLPFNPSDSRIRHEAISSWLLIGNTAWIKEVAAYAPENLPASYDTWMAYCAARRRDRIVRVSFKNYGWDHSFRENGRLAQRCHKLLATIPATEAETAGVRA
jgi:hypothetical protein